MSLLLLLKQASSAAATLTCSGGSVSLVGNEVTFRIGRRISADVQTYNVSGIDAIPYKSITAPTDIAQSLKGWFDASNESSLTVSTNSLTVWNDLSGQNDHLDTIQGNNPKSRTRTISGKNAIEFTDDGAIYDFDNTGGTTAPQATIGLVFVADANTGTIVSSRTTLDSKIVLNATSNLVMYGNSSNQQASTRTISNSQIYTVVAVFDGTNSKLWINGVSESMSSIIEDRILIAMIGAGGAGDTNYFDGLVGEVAIYDNALTDSQALSLNSYLYKKWVLSKTILSDAGTYYLSGSDVNLIVGRKLITKVYADEQLFSDNFTGVAGNLGTEYTQQGDAAVQRDGLGNVRAGSNNRVIAWPNTVTFSNDQYAEITITQVGLTGSHNSGIGIRIQSLVSPGNEQGYIFKTGNGGAAYTLAQYTSTSTNQDIATTNIIPQNGDRIRAVVVGNAQYFYVNDQLITTANSTAWSTGVPAIYGFGTTWLSDNFVAGNYGGLHLAGTYTNTRVARTLICASASYALDGKVTNLLVGRKLTSDTQTYTLTLKDATLTKSTTVRTITANVQSYTLAGGQANLIVGRKLISDTRTYTFAPQPANLLFGRKLTSDTRTYTFAPQPANLKATRTLSSTVQSYTLSLKDASLKAGKKLTSDVGLYTLSLKDAALKVGRKVTADKQTYTFNGNNANLKASRSLLSATQNYTLSLKDAALKSGRKLTSDTRTYTFAPQPANLLLGRKLTNDVRAYTLSLKDANLKATRILTSDKQTYTLTGIPVGLSKTGALPPLVAITSTFTLNGSPVTLRVTRRLISDSQSYTFNGNPTNLLYGRKVTADKQTYTLSLKDAAVKVGKRLVADKQTYTISLKDAALSRSRKIVADSSSYSLSLKDANVKIGRKLAGNVQTYTLSLKDAALKSGRKLTGDTRSYSLSLKDSNLRYGRKITGEQASYVFTYNGMLFARGGFVKVWTGSAWVQKPLKVWNGTAWVSKPLKIWTGTTWRTY